MSNTACYYDILQVSTTADDLELKKGYRKQAIIWHPDKNPTCVELATRTFAQIQHAYEVLSDPQERAWYDAHREYIINGTGANSNLSGDGGLSVEDLLPYFQPHAYSVDGAAGTSFFKVFGEVFSAIARMEKDFDSPDFGSPTGDYIADGIETFYNIWDNFGTTRDFGWFDQVKVDQRMARSLRRAIEKDNKKLRDNARKEFNNTVRELAYYVRKRDPRYKRHQAELSEQKRVKMEQQKVAAEAHATKKKLADQAIDFELPAWAQVSKLDQLEFELNSQDWSMGGGEPSNFIPRVHQPDVGAIDENFLGEEVVDFDEIYCPACDREFQNPKQLHSHNLTKSHLRAVAKLKADFINEGEHILLDSVISKPSKSKPSQNGIKSDKGSGKTLTIEERTVELEKLNLDPVEDNYDNMRAKSKNKKKKKKNVINTFDLLDNLGSDLDNDSELKLSPKAPSPSNNSDLSNPIPSETTQIEADYIILNKEEITISTDAKLCDQEASVLKESTTTDKKSKKKGKKSKPTDDRLSCQSCQTLFTSRNQLFSHLKVSGHAQLHSRK